MLSISAKRGGFAFVPARFVRSEEGLELGRGPDLLPPSVKHMNR
jgi:hypothetical protein